MKLNIFVQTLLIVGSTAQPQCDDQEHCTHADEGNLFKLIDSHPALGLTFQDIS